MIFIHELGHYLTARLFDVAIKEFALGMGPKILSHRSKKTGIAYSLRLLPIGGFVAMVGEDEESDDERALHKKPVWQRLIITAAGSVMNIILGIIITFVMILSMKNIGSTVIAEFNENAVSSQYLKVNDEVIKIGNARTHTSTSLMYEITYQGYEPLDITVIRNGEKVVLHDVTFGIESDEGVSMGVPDFIPYAEAKTPLNVIKHTFYTSVLSVKIIWQSIGGLITGRYGFDQVSGPVGVTTTISAAAKTDIVSFLYLCSIIAMNLGIFNLLPLPALDGGRIVFQFIELIRRKPINPKYEGYVHLVGIILLMVFMVIITYKDILKLIV